MPDSSIFLNTRGDTAAPRIKTTGLYVGVDKKTAASADAALQIREQGKVFRTVFKVTVSTSGQNALYVAFPEPFIAPKNSDVRVIAQASTTAVSVSAAISGRLALIQ